MVEEDAQVHVFVCHSPPVFKTLAPSPPQTTMSLPVHTAVCAYLALGALLVLVAVQLSPLGSYLPPVFYKLKSSNPPHTINSIPVHPAPSALRVTGAPVALVA